MREYELLLTREELWLVDRVLMGYHYASKDCNEVELAEGVLLKLRKIKIRKEDKLDENRKSNV